MKIFVIAPENGTRHGILCQQLAGLPKVEVELFPARILRNKPAFSDTSLERALHNLELLPGDVGCALSHHDLYQQIDEGSDEWCLVFEDDARIADLERLKSVIDVLEKCTCADPVVLSLFSEGAVLKKPPFNGWAQCVIEPSFAVGYFINKAAAPLLFEANRKLGFCSDWPRASEVSFWLNVDQLVKHGDETTSSIVGNRLTNPLRRPLSMANLSVPLVLNRISLYTFVHYLKYRRHFSGPVDYFRKVLRHRIIWHLARALLTRRQVRRGIFVMSLRRLPV